ncbi:GNAT family N-acetyltransferase [Flexivirga alba]|uniref:GNAT family N-acetyltransferase n=1 Tax=Flexivirga alba TaxID=702742 RepID=A0ABW2AET6_9MICO
MTTGFAIRPARPEDAEAVAAVRRLVFPYKVMSAGMVRHAITAERRRERFLSLVAEQHGNVVGWGNAGLNIWTSTPGQGKAAIFVHPDHRQAGIGSELSERLHQHLADAGAQRTQSFIQQDSFGFAATRGYDEIRRMHFSGVPLTELPKQPETPNGITLRSYDELDPRAAYTAEMLASVDEPTDTPTDSIDYDDWIKDFWNDPAIDKRLSFAALAGEEVVSFTLAETDGDRLWSAFSGTVPQHRGRGLSKLVKSAALHRAADAGVATAYTSNDDRNGAMLTVNDWLGYRRTATEIGAARTL